MENLEVRRINYRQYMEYQRYNGNLNDIVPQKGQTVVLAGLSPVALAGVLGSYLKTQNSTVFVIVPTPLMAGDLAGDLSFFWPDGPNRIHLFPDFEAKPFLAQATSPEAQARRQWALYQLMAKDAPQVIIASAPSLLRLTPSPTNLALKFRRLSVNSEIDLETLRTFFTDNGYTAVGQVESRGDFSVRGDIVDVYPAGLKSPVRIGLFGDFIESIRLFNIHDQRSTTRLDELLIGPVSEFSYNSENGTLAAKKLETLADQNSWHSLLWQPLTKRFQEGEGFSGLESWSALFEPLVHPQMHIGPQVLNLIYEPEECYKTAEAAHIGLTNHFDRLALEERPHLGIDSLYLSPEKLFQPLAPTKGAHWRVRQLPLIDDENSPHINIPIEANTNLAIVPSLGGASATGLLGPLAARIRALLGRGINVNLVMRTAEQSKRLAEMLAEYDLAATAPLSGRTKNGNLFFKVGQLSGGFVAPLSALAYISEDEVFGGHNRRRRKSSEDFKGLNFANLKDLTPGDFVVHNIHGIGQYQGLVTLNLSYGQKGDFLHLTYKGGDKLYVPVELFNAVGKYVGAHDHPPALDRLGGLTWGRLKAKVKENIRQMAEELLKLYAARKIAPGHAYGERDHFFTEFEAAFEYVETPDQRVAIDDVLEDLIAPRPMDRLICGDVGYGKTEVAMRASFKVISEGRQVAVLVPTTILAQQHGRTFDERLSPWGVKVAALSRFKKPKEIKAIINQAAKGEVDVIIGTHRLLQKDVKFKNLGLVIIDEEHRFGVSDKEKLKKLRASIDVLAMSATPIPRSLSMSLAGIRDLSSIATPPQDRLAVKTTLLKYEDEAVCEAIDRELARGGQVFLIHNRVRDIHLWANKLRRLMPLVRFGIGHGQMKEQELEDAMGAFLNKEMDVWIITTIVESGLDFPAAGTIIINRADHFGLAQLYQLRGRVGRGSQQAYAYLMVDNPDTITADAKKRLKALLDNSDLGSGYQIAMHDLQIRGSGNILGAAQSGQAQLVGYEMYTQLMEQAISELKGAPYEEDIEPEVIIGVPAYLPECYVPDTESRLVLYRRLASASDDATIAALVEEMLDRFGEMPPEAAVLIGLMEIKIMLKRLKVRRLETGPSGLTLTFGPDGPANYDKVMDIVTNPDRKVRLSPSGKLFVGDIRLDKANNLEQIKNFLPALL
ncbi:MAG: transcription-repair coupling factor [Candidatus Adiutrix sp.]